MTNRPLPPWHRKETYGHQHHAPQHAHEASTQIQRQPDRMRSGKYPTTSWRRWRRSARVRSGPRPGREQRQPGLPGPAAPATSAQGEFEGDEFHGTPSQPPQGERTSAAVAQKNRADRPMNSRSCTGRLRFKKFSGAARRSPGTRAPAPRRRRPGMDPGVRRSCALPRPVGRALHSSFPPPSSQ